MTSPEALAGELARARARCETIAQGGLAALDAWRAARVEVLALERRLAAARGEPHAVPLDGIPAWEKGAPEPRLEAAEGSARLVYHALEPRRLGVVVFSGVRATRVTPLEPANSLPGREPGRAQRIELSRWAAERGGTHLVFWFHDEAIEVLAEAWQATITEGDE